MDNALSSKPTKYKYARTQRIYLNLVKEQLYEQARWDLKKYISIIFNPDKAEEGKEEYVFEFFHEILIEELFKFLFADECDRLMFLLPPRVGKSELGSILIPSWIYGIMAYRVLLSGKTIPYEIIQSSYGDDLLKKFLAKQVTYVESEDWKSIFPQVRLAPKGGRFGTQFSRTAMNLDFIADLGSSRFREIGGFYKKSCSVWSVPLFGSVTGMGANLILLDDMVKGIEEADSQRMRDKTWNWWLTTLSTRLQHRGGMMGKVLALNTNWHEDDITQRLEAQGDWRVIRFPAYAYPKGHNLRDLRDPRKEGEPLSKIKDHIIRFEQQKKTISKRHFSALYQQVAVPLEGNIIKGKDIKFYTNKPEKFDLIILSADLGFKGNKTELEKAAQQELSYTVYETWGLEGFENFYLLDQRRGRWSFTEQEAVFLNFLQKWPNLNRILIEDAANGQALFSRLEKKFLNMELIPARESKALRLKLVSNLYEHHRVFYPDESVAPWVRANIEEITKFPTHKFRDTVDVASQALHWLDEFCQQNRALDALGQM